MIRLGDWFEPSYGNAVYLCLASLGLVSGTPDYGAQNSLNLTRARKLMVYNLQKAHKVPEIAFILLS
jgi:hypothetical protein